MKLIGLFKTDELTELTLKYNKLINKGHKFTRNGLAFVFSNPEMLDSRYSNSFGSYGRFGILLFPLSTPFTDDIKYLILISCFVIFGYEQRID